MATENNNDRSWLDILLGRSMARAETLKYDGRALNGLLDDAS